MRKKTLWSFLGDAKSVKTLDLTLRKKNCVSVCVLHDAFVEIQLTFA